MEYLLPLLPTAAAIEQDSRLAQLLLEYLFLRLQVFDGLLLLMIDATRQDQKEQLPWL